MKASILALATEVPLKALSQEEFCTRQADNPLLKRIAEGSKIAKRHTILPDFYLQGSTGERNNIYKVHAPPLAESACRKALKQWGGDPQAITHIISISCTGMMAPGIEFLLLKPLGLSRDVERLGINFMGCFGAFKGIAIAKSLALESPHHRILVVCTELCSLHFQTDLATDTLVSNALFGDGAAALIIGQEANALFEIHAHKSTALKDTETLMTWEPQDQGYKMRLSASVPEHLETHIDAFARKIAGTLSFSDCTFAVHPGGKAILESIQRACALSDEQLSASWNVLATYGNMSSPTFLFVLEDILKNPKKTWALGLGFGPGLSVEGVLLKHVAR